MGLSHFYQNAGVEELLIRSSPKRVVFYNFLTQGDVVLADRGFNISKDVALHMAKLEIPAFCQGVKQLSQKDVECSARLAKVRIHVERQLKNKYTLLQGPLPTSLIKHSNDNQYANIDKLLTICAALTNLSKSIVPS